MESLNDIELKINKLTKKNVAFRAYNEKLDKQLLLIYLNKSKHEILVFDKDFGFQEIARISYAINDKGVFVSDFIVKEEYQQNGIGRLLFNTAIAHGYSLGAQQVYGYAAPIDSIKGVSDENDEELFKKEKAALKSIYEKLGCKVVEKDGESEFVGNISKELLVSDEIQVFVNKIIEFKNQEERIK